MSAAFSILQTIAQPSRIPDIGVRDDEMFEPLDDELDDELDVAGSSEPTRALRVVGAAQIWDSLPVRELGLVAQLVCGEGHELRRLQLAEDIRAAQLEQTLCATRGDNDGMQTAIGEELGALFAARLEGLL
jgi:hypothetical protein